MLKVMPDPNGVESGDRRGSSQFAALLILEFDIEMVSICITTPWINVTYWPKTLIGRSNDIFCDILSSFLTGGNVDNPA